MDDAITCSACRASCCRLQVLLIGDADVPDRFIDVDEHGSASMARLDDGWCAALDRDTFLCTIYAQRPWICREFAMGGGECRAARADDPARRDTTGSVSPRAKTGS